MQVFTAFSKGLVLREQMKWQIGDVTVTRVVELSSSSIGNLILPQATVDQIDTIEWIGPFVDEKRRLLMSFHSLIVESLGQTIVVDTCIGNDKSRGYPKWNDLQTDFLSDFAQAGFGISQVDTVLCTHMHVDHVGWSTRKVDEKFVPTFANAKYLYAESEWNHWCEAGDDESTGPVLEDSVKPIFDAGLAKLVDDDHRVNSEVWLEPTPGHTPGHVSVHISSKGEEAIITGDMIHHPCQIAFPEWSTTADYDQNWSRDTRDRFLDKYVDQPVLIIGTHFFGPTAGRIVMDGRKYRLDY